MFSGFYVMWLILGLCGSGIWVVRLFRRVKFEGGDGWYLLCFVWTLGCYFVEGLV